MNEVRLYGRIAKDLPNVEELSNKPLLLVLAVDKFVAGEKDVDFIPIKVWGKVAKNICEFKSKGDELIVLGRIGIGKYEKNGQKMYVTEITASSVEFIGSRKKGVTEEQIESANAASSEIEETKYEVANSIENNTNSTSNDSSFSSKAEEEFFKSLMADIGNPFGN